MEKREQLYEGKAKKVFATEVNKNTFDLLQDWQGVLMIDDFGIEPISNNDFGTIKTPMIEVERYLSLG